MVKDQLQEKQILAIDHRSLSFVQDEGFSQTRKLDGK